jgi:hypothetical protein
MSHSANDAATVELITMSPVLATTPLYTKARSPVTDFASASLKAAISVSFAATRGGSLDLHGALAIVVPYGPAHDLLAQRRGGDRCGDHTAARRSRRTMASADTRMGECCCFQLRPDARCRAGAKCRVDRAKGSGLIASSMAKQRSRECRSISPSQSPSCEGSNPKKHIRATNRGPGSGDVDRLRRNGLRGATVGVVSRLIRADGGRAPGAAQPSETYVFMERDVHPPRGVARGGRLAARRHPPTRRGAVT